MEGSTMEDPMSTPRVVAKGRMTTGSGHGKWSIAAWRSMVGRSFEVPSQRPRAIALRPVVPMKVL